MLDTIRKLPEERRKLIFLITAGGIGIAMIIVSHDLDVVYKYADKVVCLNQKMMCYGDPHTTLTPEQLSLLYQDRKFFHSHLHTHGD